MMTIAVDVVFMTTRAHETITCFAITWKKTGMKRANHSRERIIEEMQLITMTTSVKRSLFNLFKVVVPNNVIESDLMCVTGDTRCAICDIAFEAEG